MKKIIFLLLGFFIWQSATSQTATSIYKLPQWNVGDTLKARTKNDSTQANIGLNYGFYRLEAILSRYIKKDGKFSGIGGYGSGNLDINAGTGTTTPVRITLSDSLYGYYNWQTEGSLLVQGNGLVGGYFTTDSVIVTGNFGLVVNPASGSSTIRFQSGGNNKWLIGYASATDNFIWTNKDGATKLSLDQDGDITVVGTVTLDTLIGSLVTDGITADSLASPTASYLIYAQEITDAGAVNNDTSNYATTVWIQDTTRTASLEYRRKAKFLYTHKRGTKYITAYYQGKVSNTDLQGAKTQIYAVGMDGTTKLSTTSSAITGTSYAAKTLSLDVSQLSSNTVYYIEFRMVDLETTANYSISVKDAVFYAESQ